MAELYLIGLANTQFMMGQNTQTIIVKSVALEIVRIAITGFMQ